jgi:hydrogenase-4 component F
LTSGNILHGVGSGLIERAGGLLRRMPRSALLLLLGFAGICGLPPFGLFLGELLIVLGAVQAGHYLVVGLLLLCLAVAIAGFASHVLRMVFDDDGVAAPAPEPASMVWPQLALLTASLLLLVWTPFTLSHTIAQAIAAMGGGAP